MQPGLYSVTLALEYHAYIHCEINTWLVWYGVNYSLNYSVRHMTL